MIANADRKILVLWVIAVGLLSKQEIASGAKMPRPGIYTRSASVYAVAAIVAEFAPDLAFWLAAGWTLTIAYQVIGNKPVSILGATQPELVFTSSQAKEG